MKRVLMLFTLLVTVLTTTAVRAQVTKDQMIADWQRAKKYTKAYLDAMPEDGYATIKPTPENADIIAASKCCTWLDGNCFLVGSVTGKASAH